MNSDLQRERFCNANYGSFNVLRIFDISSYKCQLKNVQF